MDYTLPPRNRYGQAKANAHLQGRAHAPDSIHRAIWRHAERMADDAARVCANTSDGECPPWFSYHAVLHESLALALDRYVPGH